MTHIPSSAQPEQHLHVVFVRTNGHARFQALAQGQGKTHSI